MENFTFLSNKPLMENSSNFFETFPKLDNLL